MKTSTVLVGLAGFAASQAQFMNVMSNDREAPFHYQFLAARNYNIYVGGDTEAYCPPEVEQSGGKCPPGFKTTLTFDKGTLSMGTAVPEGQQVYVDPGTGALHYTHAHSGLLPNGAILDGFVVGMAYSAPGGTLGTLDWTNGGLFGCRTRNGSYQVYVSLPNVPHPSDCWAVDAVFTKVTEPTAWEYV